MEYFTIHTVPTHIKITNLRGISAKTWEIIMLIEEDNKTPEVEVELTHWYDGSC